MESCSKGCGGCFCLTLPMSHRMSRKTTRIMTGCAVSFPTLKRITEIRLPSKTFPGTSTFAKVNAPGCLNDHMNTNLFTYLQEYRIERSLEDLCKGKTISAAAEKAGFSDSNYYSKVFAKVKGCSPREYRKRQ